MNMPSNSENLPSPEAKVPVASVGDVVSTGHFPSGVVFSTNYPDGISAAAIITLEDGSERLGFPGTIAASEVRHIEGHWDVDRIVAAWAKTWESFGGMSAEKQNKFRQELLGRIALNTTD